MKDLPQCLERKNLRGYITIQYKNPGGVRMMKKYPIVLLLSVMLILAVTGCKGENDGELSNEIDKTVQVKDIPKEDYEKPLTREWIKETYKYSDEKLDDYYVDEMIGSGEWSVGRVEEEAGNPTEFHRLLTSNKIMYMGAHKDEIEAEKAEKERLYSRAYLMEGTVFQDEIPDPKELKWLFCQRFFYVNRGGDDNSPDGYFGFMIDFENHKYYLRTLYHENEFPHDYRTGEETDLSDEQMAQIYEWFDAAGAESWDKTQDHNRELWHMGLEYKDGTVVTYALTEDDGKSPLSVLKDNLWNLVNAREK